jgi:hypothetical protein
MADIGINFRATSGFVTDAAGETYCLAADAYPTTRGGFTFGWEAGPDGDRDRDSGHNRRLAGIHFSANTAHAFRLDLTAGSYDVHAAFGDAASTNPAEWLLRDGTTTRVTYTGAGGFDQFYDATNVLRSAANWPGGELATTQNFSTGILRLKPNSGAGNNVVAHLRAVTAAGGGGTAQPQLTLLGCGA